MNKRIAKLPFEKLDDAFFFISGSSRDDDYGKMYAEPVVSFVLYNGDVAAEWNPPYGPISLWYRAREGFESKDHYIFDQICEPGADWAQGAVDREGLPQAFIDGDYAHIFGVLRRWTESNPAPTQWKEFENATP